MQRLRPAMYARTDRVIRCANAHCRRFGVPSEAMHAKYDRLWTLPARIATAARLSCAGEGVGIPENALSGL